MSDDGYAGWLRTQELAPEVAKMASCRVQMKCPHCGFLSVVEFEAETVPSYGYAFNDHTCKTCNRDFIIEAVLDVRATKD